MSERSDNSPASASSSEDLVRRLKAAANDAVLLREIVESSDSASITDAFAMLLAGGNSSASNDSKLRKKGQLERLLASDRRSGSGSGQSSGRDSWLGGGGDHGWGDDQWDKGFEEAPKEGGPLPVTVSQLVPYLRLSYCVSVCIDLRWDRCLDSKHRGAARGAIFGDLVVSHTFVGELTVCVDKASVFDAHYAFEAFKPLSKVLVKVDDYEGWSDWFHERFFISSAECGVRSIKFQSPRHSIIGMGVVPALSFAFTEPTTGGDRSIGNVVVADCYDDMLERAHDPSGYKFFAQLVEKAGELDGGRHIDFKFTIHQLPDLDALPGFKKYQKDDRSWLVNDLENGVTLEVVMGQLSVEVDVFSSSFDRDGYVNNKLESLRISWVDAGIRQPFPSKQFGEPTKTDMLLLKVFMIITKLIPLSTKSLYCKMYSFVNTKQWRRIEVVNWSDE